MQAHCIYLMDQAILTPVVCACLDEYEYRDAEYE
jgi:hypothetical protein